MTSSLMNFIVEKYLSNFVEIDTSQTKASIFSGIINLKNLKIKNEIFETINLPYFELVHGYIGNLTIKLKMPRFYKYPINVEIEKVFFHVRQKNIDKILKEEAIKSMEEYKKKLLINEEELRQKWENVDNEEPGIFLQIINDLQIEIKEVIFHYEDTISYKQVPFTLGVILNKMIIRSTNEDYFVDEKIKENIPHRDINYKVFNIDNFSIYLDCFDNINLFNSQTLSMLTDKAMSSKNLFIKNLQINDYYSYCRKEFDVYSKSKNAHQYILYRMRLNINLSINENYLKNNLPQHTASINLPSLNIRFTLKQAKTIFKVMAYYNLNLLYQNGIAKEYYVKKLNDDEKNEYIEKYINYYKEKYYKKNDNLDLPPEMLEIENALSFEDIRDMREIGYKKLDYIKDFNKKKKELEEEEQKWIGKDSKKIDEIKKELNKLEKEKQKLEKSLSKNKIEIKTNFKETYEELNERISDINSYVVFSINEIKFIIYENAIKINQKPWEYKDILIKFIFTSFDIEGKIFQNSIILKMSLDNAIISHEKSKNPNFQKLFFGDIDNRGKVLYMEFEKNPKFEKSDYKFIMKSEKRIHILYDIHIFNYIIDKVMNILNTKINFEEIKKYAKQDSVNKYIQSGYVDSFLENFQHFNIDLNIDLTSPIILLPLDPFSSENNNKSILLRLGKLELKSDLPPRQEKDKDYKTIKKEKLMYDVYIIKLLGTKLSTLTDCTPVNDCVEYKQNETKIIRDFDLSVVCKKLIEIKNESFDDLVCELNVSKVEMKIDEFQILFIIDYLGNFLKNSKLIFKENEIDKFLRMDEAPIDEEEIIKDYQFRQSIKMGKNIQKKITKNKITTNDQISERISEEDKGSSNLSGEKEQFMENKKTEEFKITDLIKTDRKSENDIEENNKKECKSENDIYEDIKIKDEKGNEDNKITLDKKEDKKEEDKKNDNENNEEFKKKDTFERINEIKNKKRTISVQFTMNEMSLSIKKIHTDLNRENFLILDQKEFKVEYFMMDNNDMLTILRMKNIYLYDKDIDEKKFNYTAEPFQCLINSSQNKKSLIDMTCLYRKIEETTEIDTIFDMNDLNITISFDSLLRVYQFMMYYYDKYNEMVYEIEHPQQNKTVTNFESFSLSSNRDIFNRTSNKHLTQINNKMVTKKTKSNKSVSKRKSANINLTKKEKIDSKITIIYNMKNTIFKIPLDAKKLGTPLISFSFNLIYNQKMRNLYTNILQIPQNLLIEKIYEIQDSTMNLLVSKVYLDIEFKNLERSTLIYENEKLISNFRMALCSSSFLNIPQKQSINITDINLEPLFCKFGVRQMGKILEFYNKFNTFWFDFNNIKYIPLIKPEYISNGVVVIEPKKKKTFRECVIRIMIANHIRKAYKVRLDLIRAKYKRKSKIKVDNIDNISDFNSHFETKIKFDKIIMTFYDNVSAERRLLLNLNIVQIFMKTLSNTIIKDKNNVYNTLSEMLVGEDVPFEKYNIDTLANFMNIYFGLEINYFNLVLNEFEPLMEKIKVNYLSMQTCTFSRKKNNLYINDIINFNISSNAIKVVNLFLLRYYQKETEKKEKAKLVKINSNTSKRKKTTIKRDNIKIDKNREISLLLINYTELDIQIKFESIKKKYILESRGTLSFYKTDLILDKSQSSYSNRLSAKIDKRAEIRGINFGRNNTRQYKLKLEKNNREYDLYVSVKVNTSGLIKQVHFCPSISIFNDTNYKEIEISIKDPNIKKNSLIIPQNEKCFVPLTWVLSEPPLSNVYMKIKHNIDEVKIYDHINQVIINPRNEEENMKKEKHKKQIEKDAKKNKNKYWNQNEFKFHISECDNRKNNKLELFFEERQRICFYLDYYSVQSKEIKNLLEEKEKEMKSRNNEDTITTLEEYENEYSYDYLVYIRPFATFNNQLPFNLIYTHGNSIEKNMKTLSKSSLYSNLNDEKQQIRITFYYNGDKYRSPYFKINDVNSIELLNYDKPEKPNLSCCILKSTKIVQLKKNFNYDVKLIEFSNSSYEYTFFFKYLIMNKMPTTLWIKPYKNKNKKLTETELKSGQLTVMNYNIGGNKYIIKEENSRWSKKFDLKTISSNGTIEIDTEIEKEEKNIINTKDISCILSWGKNYDNSRILIFQQQFLIHNKLNFDIYYRQENDKEKINHFLKKETFESICRTKEKKIFKLGLFDTNCGEFNYSSPFDIGILKTIDLLIKINELDKDKYDNHFVYTNNEKNYYVLVRIESHIFSDGLILLIITSPYFPSLKIENESKTFIKIFESKFDNKPLIVNNNLAKGFPFIWKNTSEEKSILTLEIYGIQKNFSFSKYEKESFEIDVEEISKDKELNTKESKSTDSNNRKICKYITFYVYAKNKSLTRCLKIEEKENINEGIEPKKVGFNIFRRNQNKITSTSFNIIIKGIGFSIINEAIIELFYISFYSINFKYSTNLFVSENNTLTENTENFMLHLSNFQIDYCLHDSIKYIIAPRKQIIPPNNAYQRINNNELVLLNDKIREPIKEKSDKKKSSETTNSFIKFVITKQFTQDLKTMDESTIFKQIDFVIQEFICKIDQYTLTNLLNIINEFIELLDYSKKIEEESNNEDLILLNEKTSDRIKKLIKNKSGSKVLINYLFISSMKIYLTIRLNLSELYTSGLPKIITRVLGSIGNSLARFTDIPLTFTEKGFENIYISISDIIKIIIEDYKRKGTKQILKVIGSSDLIGNPVKLLEGIGTGFYELVNEPRKGFIQGPLEFGKGIAKGLGKLLSGILGGTFGVVESITGTLYSATQSLMGRNHENFLDEEEGPGNIASGTVQGLYGGFKELANGITGVVLHPIKETKKNGVKGFFKGLGKGFIGLVISPFAALLRIVHSFVTGTKNTINLILGNSKIKIKRFRHPRVLLGGIEPLRPYEFEKAEAKQALFKFMKIETNHINHINYAQYFFCGNKGFDKELSLFIKTDKMIFVIYGDKKIVFSEKIKTIKKCSIHFIDGQYIIKFDKGKLGSRGFKVKKEFYAMVCKIYDLLKLKEPEKILNNKINEIIDDEKKSDEYDKNTIIDVNEKNNGIKENNSGMIKRQSNDKEAIRINNYYNIKNINNFYNISNFNGIPNIYNNNKKNDYMNKNIKKNKTNIKEDSNKDDTIINNNSIFFSETLEYLSEENKKDLKRLKHMIKNHDNSSIKSSIDYNSNDSFFNRKYLKFSESSS